jgi:ArsR family metal-binding transcriptional regulator
MLIEKYTLEVFTPPCEPGAERYSAIARLDVDIGEAFPYLNAELRGAVYTPAVPAVAWKKAGHNVNFQPYQIAISNVEDRNAATKEVEGLIKLVNQTWERRADIQPDHETHRRPGALQIYKLLPGTNCRECGQPTCYTFALRLAAAQVRLADCPVLDQAEWSGRLAQLQAIIIDAPAIGRK